jgi:rSAM/selenodomain-associated transferase 2
VISVIVPTLNEEAVLEHNLRLLRDLQPGHELLIVDGGSADRTQEIAARWGHLLVGPSGRAAQMNHAARSATGDVLVFLHADTWLEAEALSAAESAIAEGAAGGGFTQVIEHDHFLYRWIEQAGNWRVRQLRLLYGDGGIFVARRVFRAIGGFPVQPVCEEFGFSRALQRAGRVVLLPARIHVSARRWEQQGIARATLLNWCVALLYLAGVPPHHLDGLRRPIR